MASPGGVATWIEENLQTGPVTSTQFMGGSSWSSAYVYETPGGKFFVKTAQGRQAEEMFFGERHGLEAMAATGTLRIPKVFHCGALPDRPSGSFIVMEYLNIRGRADPAELGRRLALMHLAEPAVRVSVCHACSIRLMQLGNLPL